MYCWDQDHALSPSLDQDDEFECDLEALGMGVDKDSPLNVPTPGSEVAESHPPFPSED